MTSTASKPRRKTKASRAKSFKASASMPQRSLSPSRTVSCERDPAPVDVSMGVDVSPAGDPAPRPIIISPPLSHEPQQDTSAVFKNGSLRSLPDGPSSPSGPHGPSKLQTSPSTTLNHPDPIVSLSPAGQPAIRNIQFLTDQEKMMPIEQWIRQEISLSYERLLNDGQRQIELFKAKGTELRKCIDEL